MATFESVWRRVRTYCPTVDALLVRQWVQDAYEDLADRHPWTFLREELDLTIQASRTLAVTTSAGSATVTSAALFVSGDVGRQFREDGGFPIYTIIAFGSTSSVTLDRPYRGTAGAITGRILDAYLTMPVDFSSFLTVTDPTQHMRVGWWMSQLELNKQDPTRTTTGFPRQLVARTTSPVVAEAGQLEYEYWPYSHDAKVLSCLYRRRPDILVDTAELPGLLRHNPGVLELGARYEAARFPGSKDVPNPYYNLSLARGLKQDYALAEHGLQLRDDDLSLHSWDPDPLSQQSISSGSGSDERDRASGVSVYDLDYFTY